MAIYFNNNGTAKRMDGAGDGSLYAPVTSVATPENGDTASKAYAVGEMFIRGGKLCTCILAIDSGDTLTKDTNYKEGDVGSVLTELNSNLDARFICKYIIVPDVELTPNTYMTAAPHDVVYVSGYTLVSVCYYGRTANSGFNVANFIVMNNSVRVELTNISSVNTHTGGDMTLLYIKDDYVIS